MDIASNVERDAQRKGFFATETGERTNETNGERSHGEIRHGAVCRRGPVGGVAGEAAAETIDFEGVASGTIITNYYASTYGVIFGTDPTVPKADTTANSILYSLNAHSGTRVLQDGMPDDGAISFSFDLGPVDQVQFYVLSTTYGATAEFFDEYGDPLGSVQHGSSSSWRQFSYTDSDNGIGGVLLTVDGWTTGISIDDLSFWGGSSYYPDVPEPATALLLSLGAAGFFACAWRRRRGS